MSDFATKLSGLVAKEMADAHGDAERIAVVLERLTHALAFSIAIAAKGDPKAMQNFLTGAESYLYETAAGLAPFSEIMTRARRDGKGET